MPADEGGERGVRLEDHLRGPRPGLGDVSRQGQAGSADVHGPHRRGPDERSFDEVGDPLDVVELEPQRVVEVDVGLVGAPDPQRESARVRPVRQQYARQLLTRPQSDALTAHRNLPRWVADVVPDPADGEVRCTRQHVRAEAASHAGR